MISWDNTTYNNYEGSKLLPSNRYVVSSNNEERFVYHRPEANYSAKGMVFLGRDAHGRAKEAYQARTLLVKPRTILRVPGNI
jgi:hypothetical protein